MRTKIKVNGNFYKAVPWIKPRECDGCHFWDGLLHKNDCPNQQSEDSFCDTGGEFYGKVFIARGKEGLAKYLAVKLEG